MSYDLILVIIDRLTHWKNLSMDFVTGLPISTVWKGDSYDLILIIVSLRRWYTTSRCRQQLMHPGNCSYRPRVFYEENINPRSRSNIANPFPPDLWGYMHRFGHQPKGLIVPLVQTIEGMVNLSPPDLVRFCA